MYTIKFDDCTHRDLTVDADLMTKMDDDGLIHFFKGDNKEPVASVQTRNVLWIKAEVA
jgi:hypothetical protein